MHVLQRLVLRKQITNLCCWSCRSFRFETQLEESPVPDDSYPNRAGCATFFNSLTISKILYSIGAYFDSYAGRATILKWMGPGRPSTVWATIGVWWDDKLSHKNTRWSSVLEYDWFRYQYIYDHKSLRRWFLQVSWLESSDEDVECFHRHLQASTPGFENVALRVFTIGVIRSVQAFCGWAVRERWLLLLTT